MSRFETLGELKEVALPQGTVRYRECGTGEPIVFVHGLLVNGDLWRKIVPALAENYRCIVPDLPFGSHEVALEASADLTPPGIARLIANFIEALGLSKVTLMGSDTGGGMSQLVVANYPWLIERFILTDCDAYENFLPPILSPFQVFAHLPGSTFLLGKALKLGLVEKIFLGFVVKYPVERKAITSFFQPIMTHKAVRRDLTKVLRGISNRYTQAAATKFSEFSRPVLIVWSKEDRVFPLKYGERLAKAFPNARLDYVTASKAFIMEDQPEQLLNYLQAFLRQPVSSQS